MYTFLDNEHSNQVEESTASERAENEVMSPDTYESERRSPYGSDILIEECCPTTKEWITPKGQYLTFSFPDVISCKAPEISKSKTFD